VRIRPRFVASTLLLLGLLGLGSTASAHWTATGLGTGSATTGTLSAPTGVEASVAGGGLVVTWTPSVGLAPLGYVVTRIDQASGSRAPACGGDPIRPATASQCLDPSVGPGTYRYVVTAVLNSWSSPSAVSDPVTVGPVDDISPTVTSITRAGPSEQVNSGPLSWTVTFSEPVSGVSQSRFALATSGISGDATILVAEDAATTSATWSVSADASAVGGADGATIRLDLASGEGIADAAGNTLTTSTYRGGAYTFDTTRPTVESVSSATADRSYSVGAVIDVTVTFSEPVSLSGTPQLTLATGANPTTVTGTGSGSRTLTFAYTVAAGHNSADLDYASGSALAIAAGGIRDASGNEATLTLPTPGEAGSLSQARNIVVDTTAPAVTSILRAAGAAQLRNSGPLVWTVTFSEPVSGVAAGDFDLQATGGGVTITDVAATSSVPSQTWSVTASTTAAAGSGTVGLNLTTPGAIQDPAGNVVGATVLTGETYTLDTARPAVTGVSSPLANGTYGIGALVDVTVTFSEPVVVQGTPGLLLRLGAALTRPARYTSGSGSASLTFTYTVQAGDSSTDLDYASADALVLDGGSILDSAGNAAVLTLPPPGASGSLGASKALVVDGVAPIVTVTEIRKKAPAKFTNVRVLGTAEPGAGAVTVYLCTTTPCTASAAVTSFTNVSVAAGGSWITGWTATGLQGDVYAFATQTDSVGNLGTSSVFGPFAIQ
jgi:hypothetical protein